MSTTEEKPKNAEATPAETTPQASSTEPTKESKEVGN